MSTASSEEKDDAYGSFKMAAEERAICSMWFSIMFIVTCGGAAASCASEL